ncbi:MAG: antibiotic biosynthesis monooxygenase [Candidatus Dormibacteraeota bacterium]|nr:antibiotic biosynthesis monooxygenase [Candidatus Dormibacteraeota bacterium]
MTEHANIVRILSARPKPGQDAALASVAQGGARWLATRDGCFGAQASRLREEAGTVAVISRWRDQSSLDAVLQSPEYRTQTAPLFDLVDGRPTAVHYTSADAG